MLANVDIIISAVAVCAVSTTVVPQSAQPWRFWCGDLFLFFAAIVVYTLVVKRLKLKAAPGKSLQQDPKSFQDDYACAHLSCKTPEVAALEQQFEHQHDAGVSEQVAVMQRYACQRNIYGTLRVFRELRESGAHLDSIIYNTVLQAWINCGNIAAAEDWMEEIREAGVADHTTFSKLIKAVLKTHAYHRAGALLQEMRRAAMQPDIALFNELLNGCVWESHLYDGISLLEDMHATRIEPDISTFDALVRLLNTARNFEQGSDRVLQILRKYEIEHHINSNSPTQASHQQHEHSCVDASCVRAGCKSKSLSPLPTLAAVILRADNASSSGSYVHEVQAVGGLNAVKAARKTFKQHGFLDKDECYMWPLNGHWETEHGLTVLVEGKIVRWSRQRASKLQFSGCDRSTCVLTLYGEATQGHLAIPGLSPEATKSLRWDNGDVWHCYDGRVIGQATMFAQTMTKTLRDNSQDTAFQAKSHAVLSCVSKQGLCVPAILLETILRFIGNDLYFVTVRFESPWNPQLDFYKAVEFEQDIFDSISRRHPRIGFRHCWANQRTLSCGQRTLVNGEELDEECFSRHIKAVR